MLGTAAVGELGWLVSCLKFDVLYRKRIGFRSKHCYLSYLNGRKANRSCWCRKLWLLEGFDGKVMAKSSHTRTTQVFLATSTSVG